MTIVKNDLPVLEYDSDPVTIVELKIKGIKLPEKAVFAFTGTSTDKYAEANNARIATVFETITRDYNIYIIERNGQEICLMQAPMGAAAAIQSLEMLLALGVKKVLATGSCGVLADIPENSFIVPTRALRAEGVSYQYIPKSRFIDLDHEFTEKLCSQLDKRSIHYRRCTTWTTDCIGRETAAMVEYRRNEGCETVDMECSAMAACARFRGAEFAQLFFTADSLADVRNYDRRSFGVSSREKAIEICMDIITEM